MKREAPMNIPEFATVLTAVRGLCPLRSRRRARWASLSKPQAPVRGPTTVLVGRLGGEVAGTLDSPFGSPTPKLETTMEPALADAITGLPRQACITPEAKSPTASSRASR